MGDASDAMVYDRRRSEQSNAPLHMKQDTTSIEKLTLKHKLRHRHRLTYHKTALGGHMCVVIICPYVFVFVFTSIRISVSISIGIGISQHVLGLE